MGSIFSALNSVSDALQAFQQSIDVTQNNVTNANSPGYAKQVPTLESLNFQAAGGYAGGVAELTQDTRNQYAEVAVQQQVSLLGQFQQLQTSLAPLQTVFDVSANSAIPSALNQLFQSFSQWSTQPSSAAYQSAVITAAQQVASAFQQSAAQLATIRTSLDNNIQANVAQINQDAATIQTYNKTIAQDVTPDAGLSAQLYAAVEDLSSVAPVQMTSGVGKTITVLLGGQTPLVIGTELHPITAQLDASSTVGNPGAAQNIKIVDASGNDVTSHVTSGSLAALLNVRNNLLPSLAGGGQQVGDLNTLAKGLADSVNTVLAAGSTTLAPPYQAGAPLFAYDPSAPSNIAGTLNTDPNITPTQLAAVDPGPPLVSNGTALKLAALDDPTSSQVNGMSFTQFFSSLTSRVGNAASSANTDVTAQTQLVSQAKSLRQQVSGVSLDEEAVRLVQLQSSYQAASKVVTVIDQLTQSLMSMIQ
jgi:flagellar hook-associated protein 1